MEAGALVALGLLFGLLALAVALGSGWGRPPPKEPRGEPAGKKANGVSVEKPVGSKKLKQQQRSRKEKQPQHNFTHPLLASALKGHSGNITCLDFSSNGKYLATCSDDRTVRIWSTKDFLERDHRCLRANVELDHATLVRFSPDCRAFIVWLANEDTLRVYKMAKREDGGFTFTVAPEDFPKKHRAPVINIAIAETGKFIMTASRDLIVIWNLKGEVLATINTSQMNSAHAVISPCSRFVASCGFTPDVKVWEVCFNKTGNFREVVRAFELKGHTARVHSFAFSSDSRRMATVSKDGTWKFWDISVEYKKQQDPYLLLTGRHVEAASGPCRLALSPDAQVLALASGCSLWLYNTRQGKQEEHFSQAHGEPVADLTFDTTGRFLASCGDRAVRVFHNAPGHRAVVEEMRGLLRKATNESTRRRLQQQLNQAQAALDSLEAPRG
ncbi:transducin beta-like protein 2 isoform X1 [Ornithorhynchus anatinus]|nr:transducin beta-like protein 2 isoform X1 [Ornithorhynchus anatinus]